MCGRQITLSKINEICSLAIPNPISTKSMHIPSLVKIHWCLLKLSSGNEIQMDGYTTADRKTHGRPMPNHNSIKIHSLPWEEMCIQIWSALGLVLQETHPIFSIISVRSQQVTVACFFKWQTTFTACTHTPHLVSLGHTVQDICTEQVCFLSFFL